MYDYKKKYSKNSFYGIFIFYGMGHMSYLLNHRRKLYSHDKHDQHDHHDHHDKHDQFEDANYIHLHTLFSPLTRGQRMRTSDQIKVLSAPQ